MTFIEADDRFSIREEELNALSKCCEKAKKCGIYKRLFAGKDKEGNILAFRLHLQGAKSAFVKYYAWVLFHVAIPYGNVIEGFRALIGVIAS